MNEERRVTPEALERPQRVAEDAPAQLFVDQDLTGYRTRWSGIQTGFVDEPRRAVEDQRHLRRFVLNDRLCE